MSFSPGQFAVTLAEQDLAMMQLLSAFAESRRLNAERWKATDLAIEIDAVHSTNEIEGSTLTKRETAEVIRSGAAYGAIPYRDFAAAIGDAEALAQVLRQAASERGLSSNDIGRLIELLQQSDRPTIIGRGERPSAERLAKTIVLAPNRAALTAEWCAWMLKARSGIRDAFDAHYDVVTRSPAGALAGRLARLLLNYLLAKEGLPPLVIDARWQPEYRQKTSRRQADLDDDSDVLAYQHFMGARALQTLDRAMCLVS